MWRMCVGGGPTSAEIVGGGRRENARHHGRVSAYMRNGTPRVRPCPQVENVQVRAGHGFTDGRSVDPLTPLREPESLTGLRSTQKPGSRLTDSLGSTQRAEFGRGNYPTSCIHASSIIRRPGRGFPSSRANSRCALPGVRVHEERRARLLGLRTSVTLGGRRRSFLLQEDWKGQQGLVRDEYLSAGSAAQPRVHCMCP